MNKFSVTYEIWTHESVEHGETDDMGFVLQDVGLREAFRAMGDYVETDCGRWFNNSEYHTDMRTGAQESRSLHPPRNITPASYDRLCRLFNVRKA